MTGWEDFVQRNYTDLVAHQQAHSNFIMQAGMQNQYTNTYTDYCTSTGGYEQQQFSQPYIGEMVPSYKYYDGKMHKQHLEGAQIWEMELKGRFTEENEKVEVKLTLSEARHLEEACEKDPELKDILAKIEEEVDFTIVVSFRDDKSK